MTAEEPLRPGAPQRVASIICWQLIVAVVGITVQLCWGRGDPGSLLAGAALLTASMLLSRQALNFAIRQQKRPILSMLMFFLKLALFFGVAIFGLADQALGAMSFAAGATTLPMAIVADTCYPIGRR